MGCASLRVVSHGTSTLFEVTPVASASEPLFSFPARFCVSASCEVPVAFPFSHQTLLSPKLSPPCLISLQTIVSRATPLPPQRVSACSPSCGQTAPSPAGGAPQTWDPTSSNSGLWERSEKLVAGLCARGREDLPASLQLPPGPGWLPWVWGRQEPTAGTFLLLLPGSGLSPSGTAVHSRGVCSGLASSLPTSSGLQQTGSDPFALQA